MSEMIDRVAEALYGHDTGRSDWAYESEWMNESVRQHWRHYARIAIDAMPASDEMAERLMWAVGEIDRLRIENERLHEDYQHASAEINRLWAIVGEGAR